MKIQLTPAGKELLSTMAETLKSLSDSVQFESKATGFTITSYGPAIATHFIVPEAYLGVNEHTEEEDTGFRVGLEVLSNMLEISALNTLVIEKVLLDPDHVIFKILVPGSHEEERTIFRVRSLTLTTRPLEVEPSDYIASFQMQSADLEMIVTQCCFSSDIVDLEVAPKHIKFKSFGIDSNVSVERNTQVQQNGIVIHMADGAKPIVHQYNLKKMSSFTKLASLVEKVDLNIWKKNKYALRVEYKILEGCRCIFLLKVESPYAKVKRVVVKGFRMFGKFLWDNKEEVVGCICSLGGC